MHRTLVLVAAMCATAAAHPRYTDPCGSAEFRESLDHAKSGSLGPTCHLLSHAAIGDAAIDIVDTVGIGGSRNYATREMYDTAAGMADFVARLGAAATAMHMPLPKRVMIVLDPNPTPPEDRAAWVKSYAAWNAVRDVDETCGVAYHWKASDPRKLFAVAHQLFHCMTFTAWPEARLGEVNSAWWAEGAAEHYASMVVPELTDDDAAAFRALQASSLFDHDKDAVVFFDWLATTGDGAVKHLLEHVRAVPERRMVGELHDVIGVRWLDFEAAYFDHAIHEPGGHLLAYGETTVGAAIAISSRATKQLAAAPFTIRSALLRFEPRRNYELTVTGKPQWKWTELTAGGWTDMPAEIDVCRKPRFYRVVLASPAEDAALDLHVTTATASCDRP